MAPCRIVHVVLSLSPGGTERLVIEICRRLLPAVQPLVCCLDEPGEWASELAAAGVPVHALRRRPGFHPFLARQIANLAAGHRASVIHCHHYSPYVYGALATLLRRDASLVYTEHGRLSDAGPSSKRRLVNPWLARIPGRIFAVSNDLKRHMVDEGFPHNRVEVIHNGIDVGQHTETHDRDAVRAELGIPADSFVIGAVGRLDAVKNFSVLIRAFAMVRRDLNALLVIVGSGPESERLAAEARTLSLGDSVRFVGYRADARRVMHAFDVYANSSQYEGVSLTILEAMAAELPIVATRVGGNPEVVLEDETGVLVPPDSADSLAEAFLALATDPARRRQFGHAGGVRVRNAFSIDRMVVDYLRVYEH